MTAHVRLPPPISASASRVPPSGIREIFNLAVGRRDVLHLEVGEPDFPTPSHIVEAAVDAARGGSGYTQTAGRRDLREAAAARLQRVHGLDVAPEQVLITHGGVQGIAVVFAAIVEAGDEVLIPDPGWPDFEMLATAHGALTVHYPLRPENSFLPDPEEVRHLLSPRAKLLVLNSPSNPTGRVIGEAAVADLIALAREAGVLVLSDEVYDEMVFGAHLPVSAMRHDPDGVVGVWSCSKTYAMTGWRVGYIAATQPLIDVCTTLQEAMITCVSSMSQAAAIAALSGPQDCIATMRDAYEQRRDRVVAILAQAGISPVVPDGAFYLMYPLAAGADSRAAAIDLIDHGVAVAPGTAFGDAARSHFRLSLASGESTLIEAMRRLLAWHEATEGGRMLSRHP